MIRIGTFEFDLFDGVIEPPTWSARPYTTNGASAAGVHMQPPSGEPFRLRVERFDTAAVLDFNQRQQRSLIGTSQYIVANGVSYDQLPYRLVFFVVDVKIVTAQVIPYAAGVRMSGSYEHSPASHVVADWTLIAVPAP